MSLLIIDKRKRKRKKMTDKNGRKSKVLRVKYLALNLCKQSNDKRKKNKLAGM